MAMKTTHFCAGNIKNARVLVIGHDPRLQKSHALASNAFFADYYFKPIPTHGSERAKYDLAAAVYSYIGYLTSHKYSADQLVLTNLCNVALPHAPKGKTVFIPEQQARAGITEINEILATSEVEIIFAMSQQVNYWLQKLEFCPSVKEFLTDAEPKQKGVKNNPQFYEPAKGRAFTLICGKQFITNDHRKLFPILHVKNWPLRGAFVKAYTKAIEQCVNTLK